MNHAGMLAHVKKRKRPVEAGAQGQVEVKFKEVTLYLVERKMGSSRRNFLTSLARSKGFRVEDVLSDEVTHVVAENNLAEVLWAWLRGHGLRDVSRLAVLDISWFTDSMREGRPVTVETRHRIQDVMEELAESSEFNESKGPCLAFRRAASVLKSLPSAVHCLEAIQGLPCLGEHTKAVMEEILTFGRSFKVEEIRCDERYQALKLFTSVFGVGPKTAEKWYRRGLRSLKEILTEPNIQLNRMQRAGFLYYSDISKAVSKAEAKALGCIIEETVHWIAPDAILALTGGFRRGKEYGHDVDFLLTMPEMGKEEGLLLHVIDRLRDQGILLYCEYQGSTFDVSKLPSWRFEDMDHFQKCFLILRLEQGQVEGERGLQSDPGDSRGWRAVRVDLVAPPVDRYAFALLGWTGSRQFGRDLRTFAYKERQMLLDNHALYDKTKKLFLPATTEEDIFAHLGLEYVEPWQRNA
uniref:DNA-directed DNA/RNA polymerase mu n=1 Tax=Hucho hucho TaxID=62062 RepID=A0A4W5QXX6_9TELE